MGVSILLEKPEIVGGIYIMNNIQPYLAIYKPPAFYVTGEGGFFEKWPYNFIVDIDMLNFYTEDLPQLVLGIDVKNIQIEELTVHALFWVRFSDREIDFMLERWDCKNGFTEPTQWYSTNPDFKSWAVQLFKILGVIPHE